MTEENLQDLPLAELFLRATTIVQELESKPSSAPEARKLLQDGIRLLRLASQLVEAAGLFSPNEEKDDVATADLRFLLVPYYLGELLSQAGAGDPGARRVVLGSAQQQYMAYLHRARQYDLLGREALALLAQLEEAAGSGSSRASGGSTGGWRPDPAQLRQNKILKFKREKEIKARLEALQWRQGKQGTAAAADDDGAAGPGVGFSDEVEEREVWLLQLDLAALKAAESVGILRQEMELLSHAASLPEQELDKPLPAAPPGLRQKLLAAAGALQGAQREQLRQGVFRPSHTLPTMTVEQWGEVELRTAREQQAAEEARERREQARRAGMSAEELEDEEVDKQRAWDDWKDDNPKGWGNSKLRPCG